MTSSAEVALSEDVASPPTSESRPTETRQRIIDAVVESVTQVGIHRTTGKEIARRSGLTWGAVQHHFGDKHGIFDAVLESSLRSFASSLKHLPPPSAPLEERVSAFVDTTWRHFRSPLAASAIEIRLATIRPEDSPHDGSASNKLLAEAWSETWRESLGLEGQPESRIQRLSLMTTSFLSGLSTIIRLSKMPAAAVEEQVDLLKRALIRELESL